MDGGKSKRDALLDFLAGCGSLAVALSGGVDSATLAYAAALALGERAVAVTARSPLLSRGELSDAARAARAAGLRHVVLDARDLDVPEVAENGAARCYFCKKNRLERLCAFARAEGFAFVADGSNLDDRADYRPGLRAVEEFSPAVVSPFIACGWTKADIRRQARAWGLFLADKPSAACLASRVAYGLRLSSERLAQVEAAERAVRPFARGQIRVRHHGAIARIEAEPASFADVLAHAEEIAAALRALGFSYAALDLSGYRTGSTNEMLQAEGKSRPAFASAFQVGVAK